jgi:hypothetical protein
MRHWPQAGLAPGQAACSGRNQASTLPLLGPHTYVPMRHTIATCNGVLTETYRLSLDIFD